MRPRPRAIGFSMGKEPLAPGVEGAQNVAGCEKGNTMNNQADFLTEEELVRFHGRLKTLGPEWEKRVALCRILLATGMRIGEIPQLRVPQDCEETGVITIRKTKTGRPRQIMISPEGKPYYLEWLKVTGRGALFKSSWGTAAQVRTLRLWWEQTLKACGMRHVHPHVARHTYASWENASGRLNMIEIRDQLGHRSIKTTLDYYEHSDVMTRYRDDKTPAWWDAALPDEETADNVIDIRRNRDNG